MARKITEKVKTKFPLTRDQEAILQAIPSLFDGLRISQYIAEQHGMDPYNTNDVFKIMEYVLGFLSVKTPKAKPDTVDEDQPLLTIKD